MAPAKGTPQRSARPRGPRTLRTLSISVTCRKTGDLDLAGKATSVLKPRVPSLQMPCLVGLGDTVFRRVTGIGCHPVCGCLRAGDVLKHLCLG